MIIRRKSIWGGVICILVLTGLAVGAVFFCGRDRRAVMRHCGAGVDCECMQNIVDNRFDSHDVRIFSRFLAAIDARPMANILEFTDEETARRIFSIVSVCRQTVDTKNQSNNTNNKKDTK